MKPPHPITWRCFIGGTGQYRKFELGTAARIRTDSIRGVGKVPVEEDIVENYAPEIVQLHLHGIYRGHEGVRDGHRMLRESLPEGKFESRKAPTRFWSEMEKYGSNHLLQSRKKILHRKMVDVLKIQRTISLRKAPREIHSFTEEADSGSGRGKSNGTA
jgi:hypothetical protein